MTALFLTALSLGTTVLIIQVVLSFMGMDSEGSDLDTDTGDIEVHDHDGPHGHGDAEGALNLLSIRALSGGLAIFGAAGWGFTGFMPSWIAAILALIPGYVAAYLTAWSTARLLSLRSNATLSLSGSVGQDGTVNLTIPAGSTGTEEYGLVYVTVQGRGVELRAQTSEPEPLPTGSVVTVLSVLDDGEMLDVVSTTTFKRLLNGSSR